MGKLSYLSHHHHHPPQPVPIILQFHCTRGCPPGAAQYSTYSTCGAMLRSCLLLFLSPVSSPAGILLPPWSFGHPMLPPQTGRGILGKMAHTKKTPTIYTCQLPTHISNSPTSSFTIDMEGRKKQLLVLVRWHDFPLSFHHHHPSIKGGTSCTRSPGSLPGPTRRPDRSSGTRRSGGRRRRRRRRRSRFESGEGSRHRSGQVRSVFLCTYVRCAPA